MNPDAQLVMHYRSTRGAPAVTLDQALLQGIAADGGLFVPDHLPRFTVDDFSGCTDIRQVAGRYLQPFFAGSVLRAELTAIVEETFSFPIPLTLLQGEAHYTGLLELFHGPTAAFKDVGAGFLAACISRLNTSKDKPLTILVATSGDTGGAVAAAFDQRPGIRVVVLYPDGRVSDRQAKQLTCWSDNVVSLAVQGAFDDCQALVKEAMNDSALSAKHRLSSANSINIGRLLPQSIYYAHASLSHWHKTGRKPSFVIPTGNLGNALACVIARECGLPIGDIVLATNANRTIADFLDGAPWTPRASIQTLASAMDVGNPSNMERLRHLFESEGPINDVVSVVVVSDDNIRNEIRRVHDRHGMAICPHTATASFAWYSMSKEQRGDRDWIIVSTAHPAKFESIVEPLIGETIDLPDELADILSRESHFVRIEPKMTSLVAQLDGLQSTGHK